MGAITKYLRKKVLNIEYLPSIACADQLRLADQINELLEMGFFCLHFDIMDGHYVDNLCLNFDTGNRIKREFPHVKLDAHMMVTNPEDYIERMEQMGVYRLAFHLDSAHDPSSLIDEIQQCGIKAGVVLNPDQQVSQLSSLLKKIDFVVLMSIKPGFPGVKFLDSTYDTLDELAVIRAECGLGFLISIDGGITPEIAAELPLHGADILIMGYLTLFQPGGLAASWKRSLAIIEDKQSRLVNKP